MLKINYTNQFKKDYKLILKRNHNIQKLYQVINLLASGYKLPSNYKEHKLVGIYKRFPTMSY